MVGGSMPIEFTPEYQQGVEDGFTMAEDYFKKELKRFYKEIKKGSLKREATTTTIEFPPIKLSKERS